MKPPLDELLRARRGPMTADLVLRPADFGLGHLPARLAPSATTSSICGYCSTGCSLKIHLNAAGEAINLSADPHYPVNLGMACPKGWEALAPLAAPDRATVPLARPTRGGPLEPTTWPTALATFVERFKCAQREHGPEAIAFLSTGQIVTEEMALLGALFKFGMGGLHCDSNTRQCMATSHVAYKQSFGFDAPPFTYRDFEESDALVFIGANPCIAHPIMWQRVTMNRRRPEIVVIDPRRTETAQLATLHLALRPKTDLTLLYGLAHLLIARGAVDRAFVAAHTTGFEDFAAFVAAFTPARVAAETGVPEEQLHRLARIVAERERVSFWWTMGVNQSHEATRTAQAIIDLSLLTGQIGRPGTGPNSITGQCNAMGSRLFGNATSLLGGYDFGDAAHRRHVAGILGLDAARIPDRPGYAYDQILDAIDRGEIRALWVVATNTAHSWADQERARATLAKLDFLVVQDMYATTETAQLADLVLPAAGWGEKAGVLINSERRLGVVRKVARAPGQALSDFAIFKLVAEEWGCGELFRDWSTPEATFQILKELSRGQPCDFSGIRDYAHLEAEGGIQWPFPLRISDFGLRIDEPRSGAPTRNDPPPAPAETRDRHIEPAAAAPLRISDFGLRIDEPRPRPREQDIPTGSRPSAASEIQNQPATAPERCALQISDRGARIEEPRSPSPTRQETPPAPPFPQSAIRNPQSAIQERRLFADGRFFTPDGRARFIFEAPRPLPEAPDAEYPFLLLTGRGSSAQWHTGSRTDKSAVLRKLAPTVLTVEIHPADAARLGLAAGDRIAVRSRRGQAEGIAFVSATVQPGQIFMPMHFATVNRLTLGAYDPHSRQPAYKACAVAVARAGG